MPVIRSTIRTSFWIFGVVVGVLFSTAVTLVMITWEWLENPGGIFRNDQGTNWQFMFDTAISWFVPTLIYGTIVASIGRLAWSAFRRRRDNG
jgi:hypothetical protein